MLITKKSEILSNIYEFNSLLGHPKIVERLGKFRRWYAYKNQKNEWLLAPSKFIGYSNMNLERYLKLDNELDNELDGRETERVLQPMSREPVSAEQKATRIALSQMCAKYGKKENKTASIRMVDSMDISSDEIIVSSLTALINALPYESRREIAKSIHLP